VILQPIRASMPAVLAVALGTVITFCANADQEPAQLKPPASERLLLPVHAEGDQIYSCSSDGGQFSWTLKAPDARLYDKDGKSFGRHFAGPSWQANDGSQITGKLAASVPSPDANSIPWLLVAVVSHSGDGVLAHVTYIQRIHTKGGKAPANGCDADHEGQEARVPYSADYAFFAPK
jgi:Protein of unknown function (DUF3455)